MPTHRRLHNNRRRFAQTQAEWIKADSIHPQPVLSHTNSASTPGTSIDMREKKFYWSIPYQCLITERIPQHHQARYYVQNSKLPDSWFKRDTHYCCTNLRQLNKIIFADEILFISSLRISKVLIQWDLIFDKFLMNWWHQHSLRPTTPIYTPKINKFIDKYNPQIPPLFTSFFHFHGQTSTNLLWGNILDLSIN